MWPVLLALALFGWQEPPRQPQPRPPGMPDPALAKRPTRQLAIESGEGTMAARRAPDGRLFVLNRTDACFWIYDAQGKPAGRLFGRDTNPNPLRRPEDFLFDHAGNLVVGDITEVKVVSPTGDLLRKFDSGFIGIRSIANLRSGRLVVSGIPYKRQTAISVFEPDGTLVMSFGPRINMHEDEATNANRNAGLVLVDRYDQILHVFQAAIPPTIRKYSAKGEMLGAWHPQHPLLNFRVERGRLANQEFRDGRPLISVIFLGAGYDRDEDCLWVSFAGNQLLKLDTNGNVLQHSLMFPLSEGPFSIYRLHVEGPKLLVVSAVSGLFEFAKP